MKNILMVLVTLWSIPSDQGKIKASPESVDIEFQTAVSAWFSAWKLVCEEHFRISQIQPVDFIFFDDTHLYTTSGGSAPGGISINGPDIMNLALQWQRYPHDGTVLLPDGSSIPIGITCFAAENKSRPDTAYFVMPLPSFWENAGIKSSELGLSNMVTGVFIHEFSHTQQMQNLGKRISYYEQQKITDDQLDDNIIQALFGADPAYVLAYTEEVEKLYSAVNSNTVDRQLVKEALQLLEKRQRTYFEGQREVFKDIDGVFLTMEGFGQYAMYAWLINPSGANINYDQAVAGVRRNKKWWSQDEGFALFLILEKLCPPGEWAKLMMGSEVVSVIDLLESNL